MMKWDKTQKFAPFPHLIMAVMAGQKIRARLSFAASFPSPQPASSLVSPPLASPSFTLRKVMKSHRLQVWPISVPITIASTGTANFSNELHDVA